MLRTGLLTILLLGGILLAGPSHIAHAQSASDIRERLQQLTSQLQILEQELAALENRDARAQSACSFQWTRDLSIGDTGEDVLRLQQFLNDQQGVLVARSGAGAPGNETAYYGERTASAVSKLQELYSREVLAPLGLEKGTGIFGARTRILIGRLCGGVAQVEIPALPEIRPIGTAGELANFRVTPSDVTLSEEDSGTPLRFSVTAEETSITVQQVTLLFEPIGAPLKRGPWRYIESLEVRRGGRLLAHKNVNLEGKWSEIESGGQTFYRTRISVLSAPIEADDTERFSIEFTAREFIDSSDVPQQFRIAIAANVNDSNGIRGVDATGAVVQAGSLNDKALITFVKE